MKNFIHKNNLDERQKSYVETVYPAHPSRLTRPIFLNDILSPSSVGSPMTQLVGRPKSPLILLNVSGNQNDLLEGGREGGRDSGRVKRRGGVVTLKKVNDKIKFHKAMRRRSCCCKWCGGISEFEEKHKDIVGNVEKAVKARTVLAIHDLLTENSSRRSSARDALREVLPEATILRRNVQRKSREKNSAPRKIITTLDGLKGKGKSSFSSSFNAKSSNRKSVLSDESSSIQAFNALNDSNTKLGSPQPDLDQLEEESPAEGESPEQDPYPIAFPPKRAFSRSTTEPNLLKRRSRLPAIQVKRGSEVPRNNTFLGHLEVDMSILPSENQTQNNFEGSPIYRTLNGELSSTPELRRTPPISRTVKVADLVKKKDDFKISPFSPLPAKSMGFVQKEHIRSRSKVTSIKIETDNTSKERMTTTPNKGSGSVTSIIRISTVKSPKQNPRNARTTSSIQLKTDPNGEEMELAGTQEFLIPTVKSPKEKEKCHSSTTAHKALSKILKKSQEKATMIYTKDIQEIRKTGMKFYQYNPQAQKVHQKSMTNFPSVHIPKLNMTECRMNSPQKKTQTLIPVVKYKDEKLRIRANDKKATWLVGNFGGPKKNILLKSFALDQNSQELKLNKRPKLIQS